jgi:hypothetical protein
MKNILFNLFIILLISINVSHAQSKSAEEIAYVNFKKQDAKYFADLSKMKNILSRKVNTSSGEVLFSIYKGEELSEDGDKLNIYASGFLVVGDYYSPIEIASDYKIDIVDIAGVDKFPEIVFYSGCLDENIDGCGEKLNIIRIVSKSNITMTDFGEITAIASEKLNLTKEISPRSTYTQANFLLDVKTHKKQGRFIIKGLDINYEYILLNAYGLSVNGFRKFSYFRKIKRNSSF